MDGNDCFASPPPATPPAPWWETGRRLALPETVPEIEVPQINVPEIVPEVEPTVAVSSIGRRLEEVTGSQLHMSTQAFQLEVSGSEPMSFSSVYDVAGSLNLMDPALVAGYALLDRLVPELQVIESGSSYVPAGPRCPTPYEVHVRAETSYEVQLCGTTTAAEDSQVVTTTTSYQMAYQVAPYAVARFAHTECTSNPCTSVERYIPAYFVTLQLILDAAPSYDLEGGYIASYEWTIASDFQAPAASRRLSELQTYSSNSTLNATNCTPTLFSPSPCHWTWRLPSPGPEVIDDNLLDLNVDLDLDRMSRCSQ